MKRRTALAQRVMALLFLAVAAAPVFAQQVHVSCSAGCLPEEESGDLSPNLLYLPDDATTVTIRWQSNQDPVQQYQSVELFAGNPLTLSNLEEYGPLEFSEEGGLWTASRSFPTDKLGDASFIAALIGKKRRTEEIVSWTAFRILTESERVAEQTPPEPSGNYTFDIREYAVRIQTSRGVYPRSTATDKTTWWSTAGEQDNGFGYDLDGESTGAPGLLVTRSANWEYDSVDPEGIESFLTEKIAEAVGSGGRLIQFGDMAFRELAPRPLPRQLDGKGYTLRHYYSVITLHTSATSVPIDSGRASSGFVHETSAQFGKRPGIQAWSGYSRGELSADPDLLGLIEKKARDSSEIPGLRPISPLAGDGGSTGYSVRFLGRVRPWELDSADRDDMYAGIVSFDVVGVRVGYGSIVPDAGRREKQSAICGGLSLFCNESDDTFDQASPPKGYEFATPIAETITKRGQLAFVSLHPSYGQRIEVASDTASGRDTVGKDDFPSSASFIVAANLRAGALLRLKKRRIFPGYSGVEELTPINAYAQFVVRSTVVMSTNALSSSAGSREVADALDFQIAADPQDNRRWYHVFWDWFSKLGLFWKVIAVITIVLALAFLFPAVGLAGAIAKFFTALIDMLTSVLQRIARCVKRTDSD